MLGLLRSILQFMPQLGGGRDGDSPSEPFVHRAKTDDEFAGELSWTPPQSVQAVLSKLPVENREVVMRIAAHQQRRLAMLFVDILNDKGIYDPIVLDTINAGISAAVLKKHEVLGG